MCPECRGPFVRRSETRSTCLGSFSPPGHDHDINADMRDYYCAQGHATGLVRASRCPVAGCRYRGTRHNLGSSGVLVEEWPPVENDDPLPYGPPLRS